MKPQSSRDSSIDSLRGIAFLAVILLNLLSDFRLPLIVHLENFHTESGFLNHATDWVIGAGLESKGFAILAILFGVGIAMMAERNRNIRPLLLRRFSFLL